MSMTLRELIVSLEAELLAAQDEAETPMFKLEGASIKTRVIAVDKTEGSTGIKFYVANAGLKKTQEGTSEHEITINLTPIKHVVMGER